MRRKPFPALSLALKVGGRLHQGRRAALRARRRGKQLMGRGAAVVCCRGCSCGSGSPMPHRPRAPWSALAGHSAEMAVVARALVDNV